MALIVGIAVVSQATADRHEGDAPPLWEVEVEGLGPEALEQIKEEGKDKLEAVAQDAQNKLSGLLSSRDVEHEAGLGVEDETQATQPEGGREESSSRDQQQKDEIRVRLSSPLLFPDRPDWVGYVELASIVLVIGGALAGVILGGFSQARGEPLLWGVAAQVVGVGTAGYLVVTMVMTMAAAAIGAAALVLLLAVLALLAIVGG